MFTSTTTTMAELCFITRSPNRYSQLNCLVLFCNRSHYFVADSQSRFDFGTLPLPCIIFCASFLCASIAIKCCTLASLAHDTFQNLIIFSPFFLSTQRKSGTIQPIGRSESVYDTVYWPRNARATWNQSERRSNVTFASNLYENIVSIVIYYYYYY